jgi:hypothetical protein
MVYSPPDNRYVEYFTESPMSLVSLRITLIALIVVLCANSVHAQNSLPLGPTNAGTDFWVSFPANWEYAAGQKYVRLYITSPVQTTVNVLVGADTIKSVATDPNDVVTVDLTPLEAQVFVRSDQSPIPDDQVYQNKAVHIAADDPIVVYGVNRTTATSDGMLLLPVNALGLEYIVASARDIADGAIQKLPSQYMVIAAYDSTTVTIVNPWDSPNHDAGESFTVTMHKGDVFSSMSKGFGGDMSGAWIRADKPVAVTAGQNCTYLPDQNYPACDHLEEMVMPVSSWGKSYRSVPYANRTKGDLYRIFAGEDNAKIYVNSTLYGTLTQKGGAEGIGWLQYLPTTRELTEFTSDKLIMVAQYNNSQTYDNATGTDPFVSVLVPMEQYQTEVVFSTPSADFANNYVNLVCDSMAYFEMEIKAGDSDTWEKLSEVQGGNLKAFKTPENGLIYVGKTFEIAPGTYRLRGPQPFTATLYGFGFFDSYGYPLAASAANVTLGDTSGSVAVMSTSDCNSSVTGIVTDMPDVAVLRSNLSMVTLDPDASSNYRLEVDRFVTNIDRSAKFRLAVIDPAREAAAVLVSVDMAGNLRRDTVRYGAAPVRSETAIVDFGTISASEPVTRSISVNNTGISSVVIDSIVITNGEHFRLAHPYQAINLLPAASITVDVIFEPAAAGQYSDTLAVVTECGTQMVSLLRGSPGASTVEEIASVSGLSVRPVPADAGATLTFVTARRADVQVVLYDIDGRLVRTIMPRGIAEAGEHTVRFDVSELPPGVYPLHVIVGDRTIIAPPVVVK